MNEQRNTKKNNMENNMDNNIMGKRIQKRMIWKKKNYRRNASLARRPPPAAFELTFGKKI